MSSEYDNQPEEDPIPPELEHLYDPYEVFKIDATPEEVAQALTRPHGDTGI